MSGLGMLVLIASVKNLSNVGSWSACWAALCPQRLSQSRAEVDRCKSDVVIANIPDARQLDLSKLGDDCPVLQCTFMESIRRTQGSCIRMVPKDCGTATASGHR